ncbi:MAG: hypothetical protein AB7F89_15185 [Pirellulaceae bacterium]
MRLGITWLSTVAMSLCLTQSVSAHFLWVVTTSEAGKSKVRVFFGESPEPDDPALLDRFQDLGVTVLSGMRNDAKSLVLEKHGDALEAGLTAGTQASAVFLRHEYGVVTRGDEPFLLRYYAKTYPSPLIGNWRPVGKKEQLPLEVDAEAGEKGAMALRVTWQGSAVAGVTVAVHGPGVDVEGVTDELGRFSCRLGQSGRYAIRARHIEAAGGESDGKKYQSTRHYSTLTLNYTQPRMQPATVKIPDLLQGVTSFGGAVLGNDLYLYGGNYGSAHEYYAEGQSGDLWHINLQKPGKWGKVLEGTKLQGLAMVGYEGALYRVGGFTALNKEGDEQDLRSQPDFARLVPGRNTWEPLAPLPEPRSSHDAAILGDTVYVVGGWQLRGSSEESRWHTTAWKIKLSDSKPAWAAIASPPFQRRALALAAWNGKIYGIGGMNEKGGPTTAVACYDPQTDRWSEQAAILGTGMDGFGASAFASQGGLYVTTMSGSIQRLSQEGGNWEYLGQVAHPRFFHRLLPWGKNRLVAVGGAHMSVGKIDPVEVIEVE